MPIISDGGGRRRVEIWDLIGYLHDFILHFVTGQWWRLQRDKERIVDWFDEAFDIVKDHARRRARSVRRWAEGLFDRIWDTFDDVWGTISRHWERLRADAWDGFYYITDYIGRKRDEAIGTVWGWIKPLWEGIGFSFDRFRDTVRDAYYFLGEAKERLLDFVRGWWQSLKDWFFAKKDALSDWVDHWLERVKAFVNFVQAEIESLVSNPVGYIVGKLTSVWEWVEGFFKAPFEVVDGWLRRNVPLWGLLRDDPKEFLYVLVENFNPDVADFIRDPLKWLWEVFLPWVGDKIYDWFHQPVG